MPDITAYAKLFRHWDAVIGACLQSADQVPGVEELTNDLADTFGEAKQAKLVQENLTAERQLATQRFVQLVDECREKERMLRGFIISRLGSRSEKLVQFGITPNRSGSRRFNRPKPEQPENPPAPEIEATQPTAADQPE